MRALVDIGRGVRGLMYGMVAVCCLAIEVRAGAADVPLEAKGAPELPLRQAAPFPGLALVGSAGAYDPLMNRMYFHGGVELLNASGTVRFAEKFWAYDLDSDRWMEIPESFVRPGPRVFHDIAIDAGRRRLYLFGGKAPETEFGCTSDLWSLSLESFEWSLVAPEDPLIRYGRQDPILNVEPETGDVWMHFGGCEQELVPTFYYRWSAVSRNWTLYEAELDEARPRQAGFGVYDPGRRRILITGGHVAGVGTLEGQRFWRSVLGFDPSTVTWEQLTDGTQGPFPRGWMVGGFDEISDLFVTYGGYEVWPPRDCLGCLGLSALWLFDPQGRSWLSPLNADTTNARVYAAGDYCRCTGELMVHGGSKSPSLQLARRHRFQDDAYFVPIEHPAEFLWLTPRHRLRGHPRTQGVFALTDPTPTGEVIELPALFDCSTNESLQVATDLQKLGNSRYRVAFGELTGRTLDALARDRLILVGRIEGERRSFLARIRRDPGGRHEEQAGAGSTRSTGPDLRVERVGDGWRLAVPGLPLDAVVEISIYDVRGRRVFLSRGSQEAQWSGFDAEGRKLPRGVYFARAEALNLVLRAKFLLIDP